MPEPLLRLKTRPGEPVYAGDHLLIPVARAVTIHSPRVPAGLAWSRPVAVRVLPPEGQEQWLPITDVTRVAQLALLGMGLAGSLLIWLASRREPHG